MREHLAQSQTDRPAEEGVDRGAATQRERQPIGQAATTAFIGELVPMDPLGERAGHLFVDKETILFVSRVLRHPGDRADLEHHASADPDASTSADNAQRWKRGR